MNLSGADGGGITSGPLHFGYDGRFGTVESCTARPVCNRGGENKTDATGEACAAVAQHVLANGEPVIVTGNGKPLYEISVRDLTK